MTTQNDSTPTADNTNQENNTVTDAATATTTTPKKDKAVKPKKETKKEMKDREDAAQAVAAAAFAKAMSKVMGKVHSFPETLAPTPKIPYEQVLRFTHYSNLLKTENVRNAAADEKNARRLMQEIRRDGLQVALLANVNEEQEQDGEPLGVDNPQRLKGKGRAGAIALGFEVYPDVFETILPDGQVPFYAIVCPEKVAEGMIMDHGDEAPLEDASECQRMCWMLFAKGWSIQEIAIAQASTLARFSKKVKDGGGENWKLREGYLEDAALTPDPVKRAALLVKADKATVDSFYGQLQCRKREESLPYVVDALLFHLQGKVHRKGSRLSTSKFIPKLTTGLIIDLERAFKKDRKANSRHGKASPGPLFKALWTKILTDQQKPKSKGKSTAKGRSKSASKLRDKANEDGMSAGVAAIINYAANTGDESERAANAKAVETVNEQVKLIEDGILLCPEAYNTFVKAVMDARLAVETEEAAEIDAEAEEAAGEVEAA